MIILDKLLPETLPDTGSQTIDFATAQSSGDLIEPPPFTTVPITIAAQQSTNSLPGAGPYYVEDHSGFVMVDARIHSNVFSYEFD